MSSLAERQAALIAALVAEADVPAGFDLFGVLSTRAALLRKRSGEVASAWPLMSAAYGAAWRSTFSAWAAGRPPQGALRDGWDFARAAGPDLPVLARQELAEREARYVYDGRSAPRPRRLRRLLAVRSRLWIWG
jgi:hypothetical protein